MAKLDEGIWGLIDLTEVDGRFCGVGALSLLPEQFADRQLNLRLDGEVASIGGAGNAQRIQAGHRGDLLAVTIKIEFGLGDPESGRSSNAWT